jgi:hypothetical protein
MLRALRNYFKRPRDERAAIAEASVGLGIARVVLAVVPYARLVRFLGEEGRETPAHEQPAGLCALVSRAVEAAARHAPWDSRCLAQALVATAMLRRRGLPSTAYLGVARSEGREIQAHAWVRCGTVIVTGGAGQERYRVLTTFASGL